jgi:hypothetical protein
MTASSSPRAIDVVKSQAAPVSYDGELAVRRKPSALYGQMNKEDKNDGSWVSQMTRTRRTERMVWVRNACGDTGGERWEG